MSGRVITTATATASSAGNSLRPITFAPAATSGRRHDRGLRVFLGGKPRRVAGERRDELVGEERRPCGAPRTVRQAHSPFHSPLQAATALVLEDLERQPGDPTLL